MGLSGHIHIQYRGIDGDVGLSLVGSTLTLDVLGEFVSVQVETLLDVYDAIRAFIPSLPDLASTLSGLDLNTLLPTIQALLKRMLTQSTHLNEIGGYTYSLSLVDAGSLVIETDEDDVVTSLSTPTPIDVDRLASYFGSDLDTGLVVELDATIASASTDESTLVDISDGTAVSIDDIGTGLTSAISTLGEAPRVSAEYTLTYTDPNLTNPLEAEGTIQADAASLDQLGSGRYRISVDQGSLVDQDVSAAYEDGNIYIQAGDLIKGRISDAAIEQLITLFTQQTATPAAYTAFSTVDELFSGPAISAAKSLISALQSGTDINMADLETIGAAIDYLNFTTDSVALGLDLESFGLGTGVADVTLTFDAGSKLGLSQLSVHNLTVGDATISLDLDLSYLETPLTPIDPTEYKDYSAITATVAQVQDLLATKQFAADYSVALHGIDGLSDGYTISGALAADLNETLETSDLWNSDLYLTANASVGGQSHAVEARLLDNVIYLSVDQLLKNSMPQATASELFNIVSSRLNLGGETGAQVMAVSNETTDVLSQVTQLLKDLVWDSETNTVKLSNLSGIIDFDETADEHTIRLSIDPSTLGLPCGLITLTLNDGRIGSLSIAGLTVSGISADISLNLTDYVDFSLTDEQKAEYPDVGDLPSLATGIFDLAEGKLTQFGLEVNAKVNSMALTGKAMVDTTLETGTMVEGNLSLTPDANYQYVADLDFSYNDPTYASAFGDTTQNRLLVNYNDKTMISMHNESLNSLVSSLGGLLGTSTQQAEAQVLTTAVSTASTLGGITRDGFADIKPLLTSLLNGGLKDISFGETWVALTLDTSVLGLENGGDITAKVNYDSAGDQVTSVEVDGTISGYTIDATVGLTAYDASYAPALGDVSTYIDADSLPLLLEAGLNTYDLAQQQGGLTYSGSLNLNATMSSSGLLAAVKVDIDIPANFTISLIMEPDETGAVDTSLYIGLSSGSTKTDIIYDDGEFTVANYDGENSEIIHQTSDQFMSTLIWWVAGWGLNIQEFSYEATVLGFIPVDIGSMITEKILGMLPTPAAQALAETGEAEATTDLGGINGTAIKPEEILTGFTYTPGADGAADTYTLSANISSLLSSAGGMSLDITDKLTVSLTTKTNEAGVSVIDSLSLPETELATMPISIEVLGVTHNADIHLSASMTLAQQTFDTTRFDTIMAYYRENSEAIGYFEAYTGYTKNGDKYNINGTYICPDANQFNF